MNGILIYLVIGMVWTLLNESNITDNGHRTRLILFWPITVGAFILGFIQAYIDRDKYDEEM